jgi:glutamine amidotransferase
VGSFGYCRDNINAELADELVRQALTVGKKFLGICVGMQLLTKGSTEYDQGSTGLNIFPQLEVTKLSDQNGNLVIPHMGWNNIRVVQHDHPVLSGIDNKYMYFVHSYAIKIANSDFLDIACYCDYGERFAAVIAKDNIIATQFHPEKSGNNGLKLLDQFLLW